jgi:hypothetical protein
VLGSARFTPITSGLLANDRAKSTWRGNDTTLVYRDAAGNRCKGGVNKGGFMGRRKKELQLTLGGEQEQRFDSRGTSALACENSLSILIASHPSCQGRWVSLGPTSEGREDKIATVRYPVNTSDR